MPIPVFHTIKEVRAWRSQCYARQQLVGFVPTMGALHAGHTLLVKKSLEDNDHTIVSIFVNPLQFAPHEDLGLYPRTLESDLAILESSFPGLNRQVAAVFCPLVAEMYPAGINLVVSQQKGTFVEVKGCSEQLEGVLRPQFFRGVATVVTKLLNVTTPSRAYFGQKDAQQCVVVRNLVRDLLIDTEIVVLPTHRESSGLALSSRNAYMLGSVKDKSVAVYGGLLAGQNCYKAAAKPARAAEVLRAVRDFYMASYPGLTVEYVAVSHPETLADLEEISEGQGAILSTAVRVPKEAGGEVRLIDNVILS